jgi:hypothetical protein
MINLKNTILGTAVILAASLQISAAATYNINVPDGFTSNPTGKLSGPLGAIIQDTATIVKGGAGSLELTGDSSKTCLAKFKINSGTLGLHNAMTNPIEFAGTATNTLKSLLGGATGPVTHTITRSYNR